MADASNRINRGKTALYGQGKYNGFGESGNHDDVIKASNSEAPNGINKGGETGNPMKVSGRSE